jgi:fibronectin-binding autotransporter adhesin
MKLRKLMAVVAVMAMWVVNVAQAANGTWTLDNAGNWSTPGNWSGGTVADGADFTATLGNVITADRTITLDSVRTIGSITVSDTDRNYTIGSSKLTLDVTSGSPTLTVPSGRTLTISSVIAGSDGLTKTGAGTLTLSGNPNQFTGNTVISDGKVALGAQYVLWQSAYDTTGSTGTIGLDRSAQATPWLGGLAGSVDLATAITGYSGITSLTLNPQTGSSVSYGGVIANGSGAMTLNKSGAGTQTLTSANTYSGATTVWAGTLALGGTSGSALSSAFTVKGGTLSLDNSGGTWANRLTDGTAISLGSLTLKSDNGGSPQTETIGATTLATSGKITVDNGTGAGTTLAVNGTVTRAANSGVAIDFVGVGGTLGSGAGNPNVTATTLPANANGILPWATVNGTQWAENNANSVRAYSGTFVDPTSAGTDATKNAQLTGTGTMGSAKSFNSLNVIASGAGQSMSLSGILTLTSPGAILKSGSDAYSITSSVANAITAGTELIAHVDGGALTISAPLNTAILGLAKGGTGDLILSGSRGTLSGAISIAGGQIEFRGSGFTLSGVVTGVGGLTVNLNAGQTLTMSNNSNSYAGPTIIKGGYLSSAGYNQQGMPGGIIQTPGSSNTSLIMSNLKLEGGVFYSRYVTNKDLGEGPGQVQILGGTSGFVHDANSGGAVGCTLDGGRELVWGSTYFNPTVFVDSTVGNLTLNLVNGIDLTGSTRTILVGDATYNALAGGGSSQLSGVIRTSSGTAGLTKTGVGILLLTGANTFNGVVTVSQGTLDFQGNANVASPNPLGQSSAAAANLLLANGTTLRYTGAAASCDRSFTIDGTAAGHSASLNASGSGALVLTASGSPAYGTSDQTRTLILTGTSVYTNTLVANLADNGTGALSVTKTGTGTWVLTGTSNHTGTNLLTAGLLSVGAAANLGASSAPLVFNGGGLQITGTSVTNLSGLGRTVIFNPGVTVTIDVADAGNTFTVDQAIPDGVTIVKAGAGKLLFDPPYTGVITIISGATLQYDDGAVISKRPLLNNGTLIVNRSGTDTQGSTFHSGMGGTGSLIKSNTGTLVLNDINIFTGTTKATAGTLSLTHPMALMNSAVDTAGAAGAIALSGVNSPIFGGLTGTVAVATAVTGYTSVTNLTLNPAGTVIYAGEIADGASGMSVTKIGAGTQILTGNNTYTGETFLNNGTLSLTTGALSGTTGITFNLGILALGTGLNNNRVNDSANITSNGGTIAYDINNSSINTETVGTLNLVRGQFNLTEGYSLSSGSSTFILSGLSRTGSGNTSVLNLQAKNTAFSTGGSHRVVVGGIGANTPAGEIVAPWLTTLYGNAGAADYMIYANGGSGSTYYAIPAAATLTAPGEGGWSSTTAAYQFGAGTTLSATRSAAALRYTGAAASLGLGASTFNLETYGILNGGSGLLTVSTSGSGGLTTPSGGGNLYLTTAVNAITVSAPIQDNGGAVTLVKSGSGTLILTGVNTFSGGIFLNAGSIQLTTGSTAASVGNSTNVVTFTGNSTFDLQAVNQTFSQGFAINDGVTATFTGNDGRNITVNNALTGSGTLRVRGNGTYTLNFTTTNNTFSGDITLGAGTGGYIATLTMNSLADATPGRRMALGETDRPGIFNYGTGAVVPLVLSNRAFELSGTTAGGTLNNNATNVNCTVTVNTDLAVTGLGNKTFTLGGTGTGTNTFAGKITDGLGAVISLTKGGAVTWILSGTNTYSGTTTVLAGKLILSNAWSVASGILDVRSGAKVQLDYTGSRPVAEFYTNGVKAASGMIYNSVNAPNHILGSGSITVGIETFKVTYEGNGNTGGAVPVDPNAYTNNAIVTVLGAGTLTKGVFSFGGWSTQAGPTYAPGSTFQITTNTTLSAIWNPAGTLIQIR